jgi:hypothetical protein
MNPIQIAALGDHFWSLETRSVPESAGEPADWLTLARDEAHQEKSDGGTLDDWFTGARVRSEADLDRWFKGLEEKSDGSTLFVASTEDEDRHGDVVEQGTWRLANFRRNPVILHEHGGGMCANTTVVGRGVARIVTSTKAEKPSKRLEIRVFWDDHPTNTLGQRLAHQHRDGFRHAGSVGFRPGKRLLRRDLPDDHPAKVGKDGHGSLFRHNELLEFSSVAIPANPQALQLNSLVATLGGLDGLKSALAARPIDQDAVAEVVRNQLLRELKANAELRQTIQNLCWGTPPADEPEGGLSSLFGGKGT